VSSLVEKGRDISHWVKDVEKLVLDEGGQTRHSSCYKPFPLSCVLAAAGIKALRNTREDEATAQSRSHVKDRGCNLGWERFSVGV